MRKGMVLWLALLVMAGGVSANAAVISRSLQAELDGLAAGGNIQALATFNNQADIIALDRQLKLEHATLAERNRRVIEALQDVATQSQPEMVAFLDNLKSQGLINDYKMYWLTNMFWVDASKAGIQAMDSHPALRSLTSNFPIENDQPVKSEQSGLITGHEIGLERINATAAWAQGWTGAGRVVMNCDTGVDGTHPALSARFRGDVDGDGDVDESWLDPYSTNWQTPRDSGSHGTHTMGTICGRSPSGDTIGVAIDAKWIAAAAVDRGGGISRTIQDILTSFQWAVDPDGNPNTQDNPDAIGNSWGLPDGYGYPDCDETFWTAIDNLEYAGSVVIFSAGNEGSSGLRSPADRATTYYNCFSVGAVDGNNPNLPPAYFTALGPTECASGDLAIKPEVTAPGVDVRSSVPGGGYATMSGTSMASPHVTGSVAVIRQVNPDLSADDVKQILMSTARDLPLNNPDGEDNTFGHGIIDLYAACLVAQSGYGYVDGQVKDINNVGIGGALVEIVGSPRFTHADNNGRYNIGLPADTTYTLRASFFGYLPQEAQASVVADETTHVDFTLQSAPSGILHGTVVSSVDSTAIAGAAVEVVGAPIDPVQTDQNGYYIFTALPGGNTYTIRVRAAGFGIGQGDIFVPTGGEAELNFILMPFESFEFDNGGWVGEGIWEWGEPTSGPGSAYDGTKVWATVLGGDYPDNSDASLKTIAYLVQDSYANISFYHWLSCESHYDGGNVSVSTDNGQTWTLITPEGGYPDPDVVALNNEPGYTGGTNDWEQAVFSIGEYQGSVVLFRLHFASDYSLTGPGWYIDAFVASGAIPAGGEGNPDINVNPLSFSVQLLPNTAVERNLTIGNIGQGLLYYSITPFTENRRPRPGIPDNSYDGIKNQVDWGKHITYDRSGDKLIVTYDGPKSVTSQPVTNPPVTTDFGGPDEFGYTWLDSNEPDGPVFSWVDITSIGEPLNLSDDQNVGPYALGFRMPFYGDTLTSINICSNGWLSFTSTDNEYNNSGIPNTTEPNHLVVPFWDDLDPDNGNAGIIYFYTNNVDSAIVAWEGVERWNDVGSSLTFEAILTAEGNITYQYMSMITGTLTSNTVGIENTSGTVGLQVAFDASYVTDGLATKIVYPLFWLNVNPRNGFNMPGESSNFTVTFNSEGLALGTHAGYLRIDSNDPIDPAYVVPCTLVVSEQTGIDNPAASIPTAFGLDQNYPNPFNPTTDISFALPNQSDVELNIFDMLGRQVKNLVNGRLNAGYYTVTWDGTDNAGKSVSSGIYFYKIKAGDFDLSRKMIMLK